VIAIAVLLLAPLGPSKADIIKDARTLAKSASAYAEKNGKAKQMFMQDPDRETMWSKMATEESHLDGDGMWVAGDVAFVWVKAGHVSFVSVSMGSQSGDWSAGAEYSYRTDGTLARIEARYAAFSPVEGCVMRERIFDKAGKLVFEGAKCTNLKGDKAVTGTAAKEMKSYAPPVTNYLTAKKLPYYDQLNLAAK
jgi:hypothetical protein